MDDVEVQELQEEEVKDVNLLNVGESDIFHSSLESPKCNSLMDANNPSCDRLTEVIEPIGGGEDTRDPQGLLDCLGYRLVNLSRREIRVCVASKDLSRKGRKNWEKELKNLESSSDYD